MVSLTCRRACWLALLLVAFLVGAHADFRVCGNYCGPGWCNGEYLDESQCDTSVEPEHWPVTGDSCADSCCRTHDSCCGHGDRSTCNPAIVDCLGACDRLSVTCSDGLGNPVLPPEIEVVMWFVEKIGYCCGTKCTAAEFSQLEAHLTLSAAKSNSTRLLQWLPNIRAATAAARDAEKIVVPPAGVAHMKMAGMLQPVPELNDKLLVTKVEFAQNDCTDALFHQQHASKCVLVNVTVPSNSDATPQVAAVRMRLGCSDASVPMKVFYDAEDVACLHPAGISSSDLPTSCHDASSFTCQPRVDFDRSQHLSRTALWFGDASHCRSEPDAFRYTLIRAAECVPTSAGSLRASCKQVSAFEDTECQSPSLRVSSSAIVLNECQMKPSGLMASAARTECA